ncbi:ATP-binding protein [Salinibius halmophilus]|uniref:ATP-binding protein n=1 Tax=Salinibius halmophilus TaxID=1853216 RepID=UPI000E66F942|nr:ATP-binding protein [Salinibius halmophilus]
MNSKRISTLYTALRDLPSWLFILTALVVYMGFRQFIVFTGLPESMQGLITWFLIMLIPLRPRRDIYTGVLLISTFNLGFIFYFGSAHGGISWNGIASVSLTCCALIGIAEVLYRFMNRLHRLNDELRIALAKSDDATIAKSKFLAVITHEIRTPLSGIVGLTDMLLSEEDRPDKRATLKQLQSASDSLSHLLNTTLEFAKLDAGKTKVEPVPTELEKFIEQLSQPLIAVASKKSLHFSYQVDRSLNRPLAIDQTLIKQVLNNLVTNAIKFTPTGEVLLNVRLVRQYANYQDVEFVVKDTGIGIPEHAQRRLFEPFEQIQDQYQRASEGTGLGLAICKEIVQLLGGQISLVSHPGEGSEFSFVLRFKEASEKDSTSANNGPTIPEVSGSVLVVEDNPINQTYIVKLLQKAGLSTTCAANGLRAIEAAEKEQFDLILMDLQMPVMSGFEATRHIRQLGNYQQTPIIALTACSAEQEKEQALRCGVNHFYSKPMRLPDLINLCELLQDYQAQSVTQQVSRAL